jgi:hypothetical protein
MGDGGPQIDPVFARAAAALKPGASLIDADEVSSSSASPAKPAKTSSKESLYNNFPGIDALLSTYDPKDPTEVNQVRVEMSHSLDDDGANFETWDRDLKSACESKGKWVTVALLNHLPRTKADSAAKQLINSKITRVASRMIAGLESGHTMYMAIRAMYVGGSNWHANHRWLAELHHKRMSTEETFLDFVSRKQELVTALQNNGYMVRWGELAQAVFLNLPAEFGPHYINLQGQNQRSTAREMVYALENLAKEIGFNDQQPRAKRVVPTPAVRAATLPAMEPAVGLTPPQPTAAAQRGGGLTKAERLAARAATILEARLGVELCLLPLGGATQEAHLCATGVGRRATLIISARLLLLRPMPPFFRRHRHPDQVQM